MSRPLANDIAAVLAAPLASAGTRYAGLYERIRAAILDGRLAGGVRLPSSRTLAASQRVARSIVVDVFEQLTLEGYLETRRGSGSFVKSGLTTAVHAARPAADVAAEFNDFTSPFDFVPERNAPNSLAPNQPALDLFDLALWKSSVSRSLRESGRSLMQDSDPAGYYPLRAAIARYLSASRGLRCEPDEVVIFSSVQQALDLTTRLVAKNGDAAAVEDPCYPGAKACLAHNGLQIHPVPVDQEGFDVRAAVRRRIAPKIIYVTPAHQSPLGVTMTAERRVALLDWARSTGALVFEDDYDSEFRYSGRPIGTLKQLDRFEMVVHAGCFSKTMFPGLRIAYLVAPTAMARRLAELRSLTSRFQSFLEQAALAHFMSAGHYARHVNAMRAAYMLRRDAVVAAIADVGAGKLKPVAIETGLNVLCTLPGSSDDRAIGDRAMSLGLYPFPLSRYAIERPRPPALLLGFSDLAPSFAARQIEKLCSVI